jgi:UDP-3-O-[3-hydroxymyristoyl] glucosamine N-acyltransferase
VENRDLIVTQSHPRIYRLAEIVSSLGGELVGDPDTRVERVAALEHAGPGDLSFLSNPRFRRHLQGTRAAAVIVTSEERGATKVPRILSDNPYLYFARVAQLFNPEVRPAPGIHTSAVVEAGAAVPASAAVGAGCYVGKSVRLGERVVLGPGCVIGEGAQVGEDSILHSSVTIYPRCVVGKRAIVHAGVVIGADGFGMAPENGRWVKIPQTGRAVIGDDVEIGANTTVDRGTLDDTVIEDGVKLDNQIQIGHNVHVGAHTIMAACVGIAGSTRIGRHCAIGGGARIWGHIEIADRVNISATAEVMKSIERAGTYTGVLPAAESREWAKMVAHLRGLDRLAGRVRELERQLSKPAKKRKR